MMFFWQGERKSSGKYEKKNFRHIGRKRDNTHKQVEDKLFGRSILAFRFLGSGACVCVLIF